MHGSRCHITRLIEAWAGGVWRLMQQRCKLVMTVQDWLLGHVTAQATRRGATLMVTPDYICTHD